jgi:hypothetical protein
MKQSFHPADITLRPEDDFALVEPLGDPAVGETFNIWVHDGGRNTGLNLHPLLTPGEMKCAITAFLPDGRILDVHHAGSATFSDPSRPASAYVKLECLEPFKRWSIVIDNAPVSVTSDEEHRSGPIADHAPDARLSFKGELRMVSPPWINGALLPESRQTVGEMVGHWFSNRLSDGFSPQTFRYDQLVEGSGVLTFEGQEYPIEGQGIKGHVRGVRVLAGMTGHTWAEGYSPDRQRGFGVTMFTRPGGGYHHSEAFLLQGGKVYPARIIALPHLVRDPDQLDAVYELACDELGLVRIFAHESRTYWFSLNGWENPGPIISGFNPAGHYVMRRGLVRFIWEDDGAVGHGFVESSGTLGLD